MGGQERMDARTEGKYRQKRPFCVTTTVVAKGRVVERDVFVLARNSAQAKDKVGRMVNPVHVSAVREADDQEFIDRVRELHRKGVRFPKDTLRFAGLPLGEQRRPVSRKRKKTKRR